MLARKWKSIFAGLLASGMAALPLIGETRTMREVGSEAPTEWIETIETAQGPNGKVETQQIRGANPL